MEISAAHKNGITIVVVGDSGSGKSSLIHTAVSVTFTDNVAPVLPPTRLPDIYPDRVPVTLIDTSFEQKNKLEEELRHADAILLTYEANRPDTRDRLVTYWLPELRQLELVRVPVILVGCKVDLVGEELFKLDYMSPIMQQFPEINACIECSACRHIQVREVFYYAQKAVLYPTPPLFDQGSRTLRPEFVKALKWIFILADHDKDGSLSDAELSDFQVRCFNTPLQPSQIVGVKKVVLERFPEGVNDIGLTFGGFVFLQALLIEKWRLEVVWTVLRKFGYNNSLRLDDLLPPSFKRAPDQSMELTDDAIGFLKGVLSEHGDSKGGFGRPSYVECLFSTAATDCPWNQGAYKEAAPESGVDGFLSEWVLMTLLEPAKSMEYLKYLSYGGDASSALRVTRRRSIDRKKKQSQRNVYQCFVFGPKNAGKSALLDAFLERPFSDRYHANTKERYAVNVVYGPSGSKKFLALREIPEDKVQMLLSDKESLAACDVAIFVYDSSDELSFKETTNLLMEVAGHGEDTGYEVPSLIVAAKADVIHDPDLKEEDWEIRDSTRVSHDTGMGHAVHISVKSGNLNDIFLRIVGSAERPHLSIPKTIAGRSKKHYPRVVKSSLSGVSGNLV